MKSIYYGIVVIIFFSIIYVIFYLPKHDVAYYYNIINSQEDTKGVVVTDGELRLIKNCKNQNESAENECMRNFYEKYTLKNGVNMSFSHMSALQKVDPDSIKDCHYISHGIGHAELRLLNGDVKKAFAVMSENSFYKNVATCGNGYFHGVIEEYAKYQTDTKKLISILTNACPPASDTFSIDCYHGMGHAALIQKTYDEKEALSICDGVTEDSTNRFACYTGVYMEMVNDLPIETMVTVKDGLMSFDKCNVISEKYRPACYDQLSSLLERFSKNRYDFVNNIRFCKQISDSGYRMHCVKVFAGRALRISQVKDIGTMCANTSNNNEQVLCTGIFARRIGKSIDSTGTKEIYTETVNDICKTLPFYLVNKCVSTVINKKNYLYLPTDEYVSL